MSDYDEADGVCDCEEPIESIFGKPGLPLCAQCGGIMPPPYKSMPKDEVGL